MANETRNELLEILSLAKELDKGGQDAKLRIKWLLERFESQIKQEQEDAQRQLDRANYNLEVLEYVRKEMEVK